MSSLTVLCPNGHRVKVSTTPNMSLLQVLETACTKKGFEAGRHRLEHQRKHLDLSLAIRFSGLPNNSLIEMVELKEDEIKADSMVTLCLQVPSGERLVQDFAPNTDIETVLSSWSDKLGTPEQGEEKVIVYMRNEIIGSALGTTTLRSLGLTAGKGLFRFFYKKPELLKDQAKVYSMKTTVPAHLPSQKKEERHLPMRLEPTTLRQILPEAAQEVLPQAAHQNIQDPASTGEDNGPASTQCPRESPVVAETNAETGTVPREEEATEDIKMREDSRSEGQLPDSDWNMINDKMISTVDFGDSQLEPVTVCAGPNDAIIFSSQDVTSPARHVETEDDDSFFELSLEEVKALYKDLQLAVKEGEEGGHMVTQAMRESQREGEKLALLGRYKTCVLRVQFPSRHTVQGIFGPHTTIGEVMHWLQPLLVNPDTHFELYTAPPRDVLDENSSLLDLNLFPASLVHFSSRLTTQEGVQQTHIKEEYLAELSNIQGANMAAAQHRRGGARPTTGIQGEARALPVKLETIPETRVGKRSSEERGAQPSSSSKLPRWFKTNK